MKKEIKRVSLFNSSMFGNVRTVDNEIMKDWIIRFVFDISTVSVSLLDLYAVYDNIETSGGKVTDWSLILMSIMYICAVILYWMFIRRYWTRQIKTIKKMQDMSETE